MTGICVRQESQAVSTAMARQIAVTQLPVCAVGADRVRRGDDDGERATEADDRRHEGGRRDG